MAWGHLKGVSFLISLSFLSLIPDSTAFSQILPGSTRKSDIHGRQDRFLVEG